MQSQGPSPDISMSMSSLGLVMRRIRSTDAVTSSGTCETPDHPSVKRLIHQMLHAVFTRGEAQGQQSQWGVHAVRRT